MDGGRFLKLLKEESRSLDANGIAMGVLSIDHENGVASCNKRGRNRHGDRADHPAGAGPRRERSAESALHAARRGNDGRG